MKKSTAFGNFLNICGIKDIISDTSYVLALLLWRLLAFYDNFWQPLIFFGFAASVLFCLLFFSFLILLLPFGFVAMATFGIL